MFRKLTVVLLALTWAGCGRPDFQNPNADDWTFEPFDFGGPEASPTPDTHYECDDAIRPLEIMPADRREAFAAALPDIAGNARVQGLLKCDSTMWYDRTSIIPGYQDSFGDNVQLPIGMRPNTISSNLIDLAVPGGHAQILTGAGHFHFPFGVTGGANDPTNTWVIDFWELPRDENGNWLPVVWWMREPSNITHRIEWVFPVGTVLGEVLFILDNDDNYFAFEVRTRTREIDDWRVDVFRPFQTAVGLADALDANPQWASQLANVSTHLRNKDNLVPATLEASHFVSAFPDLDGALDMLPPIDDPAIVEELLTTTSFRSTRGIPWKKSGSLVTWAASTGSDFHIVPRDYNGGFLEVNEAACGSCHRDAGRPFRDFYSNIIAYGELWGEDESFSWHPFKTSNFVDANGNVQNFNYDNRIIREDFVDAGIIEQYDPAVHADTIYKKLPGDWKNYSY